MNDDYIFRRELDMKTNSPEMTVHLKNDRQFQKNGYSQEKRTVR